MGWPQHKHGNIEYGGREERRGGSGNTGNNPNLTIQSFTFCNGVDKNYFLFVFVFMYIYFIAGTAQLSKIGSCITKATSMIHRERS